MRFLPGRWRLSAVLLGIMLGATGAGAQEPFISVERAGTAEVVASPGGMITLAFRVMNRGSTTVSLDPEPSAPAGWRLILALDPLRLAPGETAVRLVGVSIPAQSTPGLYPLRLSVAAAEDSVLVRIPGRATVTIEHVDAPRFVVGGEPYTTTFRITNAGNVGLDLDLRPRVSHGLPYRVDSTRVRLAPDESGIVAVVVETAEVRSETRSNVRLVVASAGEAAAEDTAASSIPILPRTQGARRQFQRLPATLTLRGSAAGGGAPPVEVAGVGSLSPDGTDRLEFLLRGPGADQSAFGMRDEYRVRYRSDLFDVQLGDQSFRLSQLTTPGHSGFGGGGTVHLGPASVGGFHSFDRRSAVDQEATGAFVDLRPLPGVDLGVYGIRRTGLYAGDVLSARADAEPITGFRLVGEMAAADDVRQGPRAAALEATGRHARFNFDVRYLAADSAFPGYFAGLEYLSTGATFRPFRWMALDGQYYDQRTSLPGDERSTTLAAAGLSLGRILRLRVQRASVDAPLAQVPTSRKTDEIEAGLGFGFAGIRGAVTGTVGRLADRLDAAADEEFYQGFGRLSAGFGVMRVSGSLQYRHGLSLYDADVDERWAARVETGLRFPSTEFRISAYGSRRTGLTTRDHVTVDGVVRQRLPFGHEIEVRAFTTAARPGTFDQSVVLLNYRVPLGIPVRPIPLRGTVVGRLYDATTGTGLSRVPVRLGPYTVVTDGEGTFAFRDLEAGSYHLGVENVGGAAGRVPMVALPMELSVGEGEPAHVELGFVRPAAVEGRVVIFGFDPDAGLGARDRERIELGGLAGVRVELRDGDVLRTVTTADGRFSFRDLRPGRWTLRVLGGPIPEHHDLMRDSVPLDLEAGSHYQAEFRIEERLRPLNLIPGGELFVEPAAGPPEPSGDRVAEEPAGGRGAERYHVVTFEDRGLFDLARKLYGDVALWPKILVANRHLLPDPDYVPTGLRLRIPPAAPLTAEERAARDEYYRTRPPR